jgi:hypothetical protein
VARWEKSYDEGDNQTPEQMLRREQSLGQHTFVEGSNLLSKLSTAVRE